MVFGKRDSSMKIFSRLLIFFIECACLCFTITPRVHTAITAPLDLAVLFCDTEFVPEHPDREDEKARTGRPGAITGQFISLIEQHLPIVASTSLLFNLNLLANVESTTQKENAYKPILDNIKNKQEWFFLINDTNDFIVLLPRRYINHFYPNLAGKEYDEVLSFIGFNVSQTPVLREANVIDFNEEIYSNSKINFENFKRLFNCDGKTILKRIFLVGHGLGGSRIALLTQEQFGEFLDVLILMNVDFM